MEQFDDSETVCIHVLSTLHVSEQALIAHSTILTSVLHEVVYYTKRRIYTQLTFFWDST